MNFKRAIGLNLPGLQKLIVCRAPGLEHDSSLGDAEISIDSQSCHVKDSTPQTRGDSLVIEQKTLDLGYQCLTKPISVREHSLTGARSDSGYFERNLQDSLVDCRTALRESRTELHELDSVKNSLTQPQHQASNNASHQRFPDMQSHIDTVDQKNPEYTTDKTSKKAKTMTAIPRQFVPNQIEPPSRRSIANTISFSYQTQRQVKQQVHIRKQQIRDSLRTTKQVMRQPSQASTKRNDQPEKILDFIEQSKEQLDLPQAKHIPKSRSTPRRASNDPTVKRHDHFSPHNPIAAIFDKPLIRPSIKLGKKVARSLQDILKRAIRNRKTVLSKTKKCSRQIKMG